LAIRILKTNTKTETVMKLWIVTFCDFLQYCPHLLSHT